MFSITVGGALKQWHELSVWQKVLLGSLVMVAAVFSPELMLFIDVGGIELAFGFLMMYYRSLILWVEQKIAKVKQTCSLFYATIMNSAFCQPRVFLFHCAYCGLVLFTTGSLYFAMGFVGPAFLIGVPPVQ